MLKCNWTPSEYTELEWGRDNGRSRGQSEKNNISPDGLKASTWPRAYPGRLNELEELVPDNPNSIFGNFQIEEMEIAERFPELLKIKTFKVINEKGHENQRCEKPTRFVKKVVTGSVLPRSSSKSTVGIAHIKSLIPSVIDSAEIVDSKAKAYFQDNLAVLLHLKRIKAQRLAEVEFVLVTQPHKIIIEELECNVMGSLSKFDNAWSYLDKSRGSAKRAALIAKITNIKNKRTRYVIEVQHKKAGESATIVIWDKTEGEIANNVLKGILDEMVEKKSTVVQLPRGLHEKRMKHLYIYNHNLLHTVTQRFLMDIFN